MHSSICGKTTEYLCYKKFIFVDSFDPSVIAGRKQQLMEKFQLLQEGLKIVLF